MAKGSCDDGCRGAVVGAYRGLRQRGFGDQSAFDSAVIVFRNHHPEVTPGEAPYCIAEWIETAVAEDQAPT